MTAHEGEASKQQGRRPQAIARTPRASKQRRGGTRETRQTESTTNGKQQGRRPQPAGTIDTAATSSAPRPAHEGEAPRHAHRHRHGKQQATADEGEPKTEPQTAPPHLSNEAGSSGDTTTGRNGISKQTARRRNGEKHRHERHARGKQSKTRREPHEKPRSHGQRTRATWASTKENEPRATGDDTTTPRPACRIERGERRDGNDTDGFIQFVPIAHRSSLIAHRSESRGVLSITKPAPFS